jgi:hypothetical protein
MEKSDVDFGVTHCPAKRKKIFITRLASPAVSAFTRIKKLTF